MRNFRELNVWQDSRILAKEVYSISKLLPESEKFGLVSQIQRASISIPANIAERCSKYSNKDFARFLQISLGSAYELESHVILCEDLNLLSFEKTSPIIRDIQKLQRKIASLIKYTMAAP
ncbi:four helix bundle protein [Flagellimonas sp. GZD32]|uniref:four helix bundle protein n=1 Tax=Flagellimonas cixiensis TaxID=3228750 RepID=UPI0035C8A5C8